MREENAGKFPSLRENGRFGRLSDLNWRTLQETHTYFVRGNVLRSDELEITRKLSGERGLSPNKAISKGENGLRKQWDSAQNVSGSKLPSAAQVLRQTGGGVGDAGVGLGLADADDYVCDS